MKNRFIAIVVMAAAVAVLLWMNRTEPLPGYFDKSLTFAAALERSAKYGLPVFAYASADWCGPCKEFKRTTLRDARVADWLIHNSVPVYLDVTSQSSPGVQAAADLGVTSIPAIFLIRDGRPVGSHAGVLDAESLLSWLKTFAAAPPPTPAG